MLLSYIARYGPIQAGLFLKEAPGNSLPFDRSASLPASAYISADSRQVLVDFFGVGLFPVPLFW